MSSTRHAPRVPAPAVAAASLQYYCTSYLVAWASDMSQERIVALYTVRFLVILVSHHCAVLLLSLCVAAAPRALHYADLGGVEEVLADIRELIEYPLKHPEVRHSSECQTPQSWSVGFQQVALLLGVQLCIV